MKWAFYKNLRQRQMQIIEAFSQIDLHEYERLIDCGKYVYSATCSDCGQRHFAGFSRCKSRFCIPCSKSVTLQYVRRVYQVYDEARYNLHFLTLTLRNYDNLSLMFDDISYFWRVFYNADKGFRLWFHARFLGGIRRTEIKRGRDGKWHVHMHLMLISGKDFNKDYEFIRDRWKQVTGGNGSVFIKKVTNPLRGILETVKYICNITKMSVTDIKDVYAIIKGKRLISTFGIMRDVVKADDEEIKEDALVNFICRRCGCTKAFLESVLYSTLLDDEVLDL